MSVPPAIRSISEIWPFRAISAWIHRQILQLLLRFQTSLGTPTVAVGRLEGHWTLYTALPIWSFSLDFPLVFSTPLAAGATGDVWLSHDKSHVIKLFMNRDAAEHEANILLKCQDRLGPAVPTFRGLYSDERRFGLVMRYVGFGIGPLDRAPLEQRQQLLTALHKLHSCGIHHHDVRPANVMVDNSGVVRLIDFDRAEEVYGECKGCSDLEVISSLEKSMSEADPEPEIIPYL
ncbi:kinase-like domain-containing protein [Mycena olivaceomarginata]|nr:kinase-like domain-containing protein [Mycena olivaceomarginata]